MLNNLQEKGILDPKLLDIVWEDSLKDKQDLLALLVKFGFFVPLFRPAGEATDTKESVGNKYLVPVILSTGKPHTASKHYYDETGRLPVLYSKKTNGRDSQERVRDG